MVEIRKFECIQCLPRISQIEDDVESQSDLIVYAENKRTQLERRVSVSEGGIGTIIGLKSDDDIDNSNIQ